MALELTTTNAEVKVEGTEALTTLTVNQTAVSIEVAQSGPQGPAGGGQRAEAVFTANASYTVTDESFVASAGSTVVMPDAEDNAGQHITVAAAAGTVTATAAGSDTFFGVGSTYAVRVANQVTFVAIQVAGPWGWAVVIRNGDAYDLPEWFGQGIADGNLVTLQSGAPAWTTGTRTEHQFLSGTGWTDDVPVLVPVKNTTASTIAKGAPVYATGTVGATSVIEIAPADADDAATMPAIGLTHSSLTANATGYVNVMGTLRGVDTAAYSVNQALYVSTTAGQLTATKPTGTSELIQNIGRVTRVNANNGEILVLGPGRTNDVPNAIDAGKLTSGTVATARLGSGTASSGTYLRGDQTYARPVVSAYYVTARYYYPPNVTGGGTRSVASGAATATPYPIYQPVSVDGLQVDLSAANGAGQSIDLHVMSVNASGDPDASVFSVNVTTTGSGTQVLSQTGTPVALSPGLYYVVVHNRSANAVTGRAAAAASHLSPMPAATSSTANGYSGWLKSPGTGAMTTYPAVTAVTDNINQSPLVAMRFT